MRNQSPIMAIPTCICTVLHLPLWFDVCASADVVFGGEDKFIVKHPLRLVVQDGRWVELDHLVVFDCEVMTCALQVSNL